MQRPNAVSYTGPHEDCGGASLEPRRIQEVLSAIVAANEQWLTVLRYRAFLEPSTFPLSTGARRALIEMTQAQLRETARCGILLADAGFSDLERWRSIAHVDPQKLDHDRGESSVGKHSVVLAYSLFAVAWYVLHTAPAAAGVLLGMSVGVAEEFRALRIGQLAWVARRYSNWVQPRWCDRPDVWTDVLKTDRTAEWAASSVILRCLKVTAGQSPGLRPFIDAHP